MSSDSPSKQPRPPEDAVDALRSNEEEPAGQSLSQLARNLQGDMFCVRCRYNLRGLSIQGPCPECGTPIRATLLFVVDPMAGELQVIRRPRILAAGLLGWVLGSTVAASCIWALRLAEALDAWRSAPVVNPGLSYAAALAWTPRVGVAALIVSALGAVVLIRPHEKIKKANQRAAAAGVVAFLPVAYLYGHIHIWNDGALGGPYFGFDEPDPERAWLRLAWSACAALVILGLRANTRLLAARSHLVRSGTVDRQTMLAMVGALGVTAVGDILLLASVATHGPIVDLLRMTGRILILLGSMLFSIGLIGVLLDCLRLVPIILMPTPSLGAVLRGDASR